jgi:hypothetical protein
MFSAADVHALHGREFRRCLLELDVDGLRRLWERVAPHLPQSKSRAEALHAMHLARVNMKTIPEQARAYSQAWLDEHAPSRVVPAVGLIVGATSPARRVSALDLRKEWEHTVMQAVREGVDLDKDAAEIKRRCAEARARLDRFRYGVVIPQPK